MSLLFGIDLSCGPNHPHQNITISPQSRSLLVMPHTFQQFSIPFWEVFSSQDSLSPSLVVPKAMPMQDAWKLFGIVAFMLTISYVVAYWKNGNTEARPNQLSQILATNIDSGLRGFRPRIFVSYCLKNKLNLKGPFEKTCIFLFKLIPLKFYWMHY